MLSKVCLWVRRKVTLALTFALLILDSGLGLVSIFPELLNRRIFCGFPLISFYPRTKKALAELEKEIKRFNVGIGTISKKRGDKYFGELTNIIQRVYGSTESSPTEVKFEIHSDEPQIDFVTKQLISNKTKCYLSLFSNGSTIYTKRLNPELSELKSELDFVTRKCLAIAFVIVFFMLLVVMMLK